MSDVYEVITKGLDKCYLSYYSNDTKSAKVERYAWFFTELRDLDPKRVEYGFKAWLGNKENRKFPRPCDIRSLSLSNPIAGQGINAPIIPKHLETYVYLDIKGENDFRSMAGFIRNAVSKEELNKINELRVRLRKKPFLYQYTTPKVDF